MNFKSVDDRTKLRYVDMEISIYSRALDTLERENNQQYVTMEYMRQLIKDVRRIIGEGESND